MSDGIANVFIIESLKLDDEKNERFEGEILSRILKLNGKKCKYFYIRTEKELIHLIKGFKKTEYKYLHLSCHGNSDGIALTFDFITLNRLGDILNEYVKDKRIFFSACEVVTSKLAKVLMNNTNCLSVIGPNTDIYFHDAAIFWSAFYHLMFKENSEGMNRVALKKNLQSLSQLFDIKLKYYGRSTHTKTGYSVCTFPSRYENPNLT